MYYVTVLRRYLRLFGYYGLFLLAKTKILTKPQECEVSIRGVEHPVRLRLKTSDIKVAGKIFAEREDDINLHGTPRVIVDAGANIGLASIYFTNRFPDARVIAVEPEQSNFAVLKKNIAPYPRIEAVQAALWNDNTELDVCDPGRDKWGFQVQQTGRGGTTRISQRVRGITLDQLMRTFSIESIDILKMDIEGAEKEVFKDASQWIGRIGILIVELHERLRPGCARSFYNNTNGFDIEWIQGENVIVARKEWIEEKTGQVLC